MVAILIRNVSNNNRTWIGIPLETCRRIAIPSISDLCHADPPSPPDAMRRVRGSSDSAGPPNASTAAGTCTQESGHEPGVVGDSGRMFAVTYVCHQEFSSGFGGKLVDSVVSFLRGRRRKWRRGAVKRGHRKVPLERSEGFKPGILLWMSYDTTLIAE